MKKNKVKPTKLQKKTVETVKPKHPGGRPTKYIPQVIYPKIEEYISSCGREQTTLPTIEGLAIHLDVSTETMYQWSSQYPQFSDAIKKILAKQKKQLMDDGMYGGKEVNAAMAIFLLKVNHGMKEQLGVTIATQVNVSLDKYLK